MKPIDYKFLCIIFLLLAAVREDFKSYKIPNCLIIIGILASFVVYLTKFDEVSILSWVLGIFLPIIILIPLFVIRVLGAGDIKLFSVIGGFYGVAFGVQTILLSFLAAALFSIILIIQKKQFQKRLFVFINYIHMLYLAKWKKEKEPHWYHYYDKNTDKGEGTLHFSLYILIGFLIASLLSVYYPGFSFISLSM